LPTPDTSATSPPTISPVERDTIPRPDILESSSDDASISIVTRQNVQSIARARLGSKDPILCQHVPIRERIPIYQEISFGAKERRDLAMAAKKAKGDDWFSSLDAELEKKTREIIEDVGEQNVVRLELNKTLIEDFWKVWKRFNKINVHFALEPSYTNWAVFPDTFPDGDWHWRPGFNTAAVQTIQLLDRSMDQGRVGDALKVNYVETEGKAHLRVTFEYCEGEHYYKYSGWKRIWTIHTLYDEPVDKTNVDDLHKLFAELVRVWYESHLRRNREVLIKYLKTTFEKVETFNQ
jgi:hypothetical protein